MKLYPLICAAHTQFTLNNHKVIDWRYIMKIIYGNMFSVETWLSLCNYLQVCDCNSPTIQLKNLRRYPVTPWGPSANHFPKIPQVPCNEISFNLEKERNPHLLIFSICNAERGIHRWHWHSVVTKCLCEGRGRKKTLSFSVCICFTERGMTDKWSSAVLLGWELGQMQCHSSLCLRSYQTPHFIPFNFHWGSSGAPEMSSGTEKWHSLTDWLSEIWK